MVQLVILVVVIATIAAVLAAVKAKSAAGSKDVDGAWPYYARKPLSQVEQVLYFRLCKALPDHIVLAQVGLSRFLGVKKGSNYQAWDNRISRMTADFVVCAKDSTIVAVIELDDASHEKERRKVADAKKDKALASAGSHHATSPARSATDRSETMMTPTSGRPQRTSRTAAYSVREKSTQRR